MSEKPNLEAVAQVMIEWGASIRGDWSNIDGRTCRDELESLAGYLQSDIKCDIRNIRYNSGICLDGNGHWREYCVDDGCNELIEVVE